ncbi:hypothetical protein J6590_077177 [Homalodisca vitripennis]|nr:hypothetical protein J6590_077177 [Homalodisca vitripennis]
MRTNLLISNICDIAGLLDSYGSEWGGMDGGSKEAPGSGHITGSPGRVQAFWDKRKRLMALKQCDFPPRRLWTYRILVKDSIGWRDLCKPACLCNRVVRRYLTGDVWRRLPCRAAWVVTTGRFTTGRLTSDSSRLAQQSLPLPTR